MKPNILLFGLLVFSLLFPTACTRQKTEGSARDNVLAIVNGEKITEDDLSLVLPQGHSQISPEAKSQALDDLVNQELLYQQGLKLGLDRDAKYRDLITIMELRLKQVRRAEMARRVMSTRIAASVDVSEEDARRFYAQNESKIMKNLHLAIARFQDEQAGRTALASMQAGKAFETVAAEVSQARLVGAEPWDAGFLQWNQIPAEWSDAVYSLSPGGISDVLSSKKTGVCVVKLIDQKTNADATYERMSGSIMNRLRDQRIREAYDRYLAELRTQAKIVNKNERRKAS